jgi:hypothetical protein
MSRVFALLMVLGCAVLARAQASVPPAEPASPWSVPAEEPPALADPLLDAPSFGVGAGLAFGGAGAKLESPAIQMGTTSYLALGPMPRMGVRTYLPVRRPGRGRVFFSFSYGVNGYQTITRSGSNKKGLFVMNGSAWTIGYRNHRLDVELGIAITVKNSGTAEADDRYDPVVSVGWQL